MTQPSNITPSSQRIELAKATYPQVMRILSTRFFPEPRREEVKTAGCPHCQKPITIPMPVAQKEDAPPLVWMVGIDHPLIPEMLVIRMFRLPEGGAEVYSVAKDQKSGKRDILPAGTLLLIEEGMPLDVFAEELQASEEDAAGLDDEEEEDDPEEFEPAVTPPTTTTPNGQSAS